MIHNTSTNKSKCVISVVTPVYNAEKTIDRLLIAMENQTFDKSKFELILIDDGSYDETQNLINKYVASSAMNIILLSRQHVGPGQARNEGIEVSRGEVIAFTDADCAPDTNWLRALYQEVINRNHMVVSGTTYSTDLIMYPWRISPAGQQGITANLAIRRSALGELRFSSEFNGLYGEDTDLLFRLAKLHKNNERYDSPAMRVEHPVNVLHLKGVVSRARARVNEILLIKYYGQKAYSSMHPMYRPLFFKTLSVIGIATMLLPIALVIAIIVGSYSIALLAATIVAVVVLFIAYGYRFLIRGDIRGNVSMRNRIQTLFYFTVYNLILVVSRIEGSVKFKFIVI